MLRTNAEERIAELYQSMDTIIDYMQLKISDQDWKAVGEAAGDLRSYEKEIAVLTLLVSDNLNEALSLSKGPKVEQ